MVAKKVLFVGWKKWIMLVGMGKRLVNDLVHGWGAIEPLEMVAMYLFEDEF